MEEDDHEVRRSGFVDWVYENALDHPIGWPIAALAFLGNVLTHLLVFRGGWTLHLNVNGHHRKVRYPSKDAALKDVEHQRALLAKLPPAEPARLPTRGGVLRRPW